MNKDIDGIKMNLMNEADAIWQKGYIAGVQDTKAKLRAWEAKQDEIKIGDEVQDSDGDRYIVTEIRTDGDICNLSCMRNDGHGYGIPSKNVKKTGRHFDQIAEVLKQMGEPE